MIDAHAKKFNPPRLASHATGSKQIDKVWVVGNMTLLELLVFPYSFGVDDHGVMLIYLEFNQTIEIGAGAYFL